MWLGPNLVGPVLGVDLPGPLGRVGVVPLRVGEDLADFCHQLHPAAADRQMVAGAHHHLSALGAGRAQVEVCAAHRDVAVVPDDNIAFAVFALWRLTGDGKVGLEEHAVRLEVLVVVRLGLAAPVAAIGLLMVGHHTRTTIIHLPIGVLIAVLEPPDLHCAVGVAEALAVGRQPVGVADGAVVAGHCCLVGDENKLV